MRPKDNPIRHFLLAFLIALVVYFVSYSAIEHLRHRKGPWQVTFANTTANQLSITINQPVLQLTNVSIIFKDSSSSLTNSRSTFFFGQPRPVPYDVPFGRCVFMDTTFLPGTVTFQLFGHEIELLPRVLIIDHEEYPWHSDTNIALNGPKH